MNREDRAAYHSPGSYKTWAALDKRWDAAFYGGSEHHLDTPAARLPLVPSIPGMSPAAEGLPPYLGRARWRCAPLLWVWHKHLRG